MVHLRDPTDRRERYRCTA